MQSFNFFFWHRRLPLMAHSNQVSPTGSTISSRSLRQHNLSFDGLPSLLGEIENYGPNEIWGPMWLHRPHSCRPGPVDRLGRGSHLLCVVDSNLLKLLHYPTLVHSPTPSPCSISPPLVYAQLHHHVLSVRW
jgi:hypothetical protein